MAHGDDARNLKWAVVGWIIEIYGPSSPPLKLTPKLREGLRMTSLGLCFALASGAGMIKSKDDSPWQSYS